MGVVLSLDGVGTHTETHFTVLLDDFGPSKKKKKKFLVIQVYHKCVVPEWYLNQFHFLLVVEPRLRVSPQPFPPGNFHPSLVPNFNF